MVVPAGETVSASRSGTVIPACPVIGGVDLDHLVQVGPIRPRCEGPKWSTWDPQPPPTRAETSL